MEGLILLLSNLVEAIYTKIYILNYEISQNKKEWSSRVLVFDVSASSSEFVLDLKDL